MNEVKKLGSYKPSGFNASQVLDADGISPTVMNNNGEVNAVIEGIKIKNNTKQGYLVANEYDGLDLETRKGRRGTVQKGMSQTINTQDNKGVVVGREEPTCLNSKVDGKQPSLQNRIYSSSSSVAITQSFHPSYSHNLRIRKLTEKECFRLMGVKNSDYNKISTNKSQKYKMAGNSIVVQVLMGIFGKLCGLTDEYIESKIIESVEEIKE